MKPETFAVSVTGLMHGRRFRAGFGPFYRGREAIVQATQAQFEKLRADPCLAVVKAPPTFAPAAQGASNKQGAMNRAPTGGGHAAGGVAPPTPECNEPCKGPCCEDCPCPADPVDPAGGEPVETAPKKGQKTAKKANRRKAA